MTRTYSIDLSNSGSRTTKRKNSKRSSKKTKNSKKGILIGFAIILTILIAGGYYFSRTFLKCNGNGCNPILKPIVATIEPKLEQENGKTNVLVVGIDTRGENSGLMNTDTIMILSVDYENQSTLMISIPRDLRVQYTLPNGNVTATKINSAYATGESFGEGEGIKTLTGIVETIVGEPIHYYAKITLAGFIDVVDTIEGIDVEIEEYYKDAYPASELPPEYQAECVPFYHDGKYCLFEFFEGVEHMDGARALIYARSRLLSPRGDFDRARRQQKVIDSVKKKILSSDTLLDPTKMWEIYTIVQDNIESSPFTINEVRAALNLRNEFDPDKVGNVVLDPNFGNTIGGYFYRPTDNPGLGYYILAKDQTYANVQGMLDAIWKYPEIYNEAPTISIYNATGLYTFEKDWGETLGSENPAIQIINSNKVIQNLDNKYKSITIYKFSEEEKPATESYLKEFFGTDILISEVQDGTQAFSGEDYIIVIGTDNTEGQGDELIN